MTASRKALIWIGLIGISFFIKLLPEFVYDEFGVVAPLPEYPGGLSYLILMGAVLVPVIEELIFRGPIYFAIKIKEGCGEEIGWKFKIGIILPLILFWSSLVFALVHLMNFEGALPANILFYVIAIAWHGLIYGLLVWVTRSLLPSVVLHFVSNLVGFL